MVRCPICRDDQTESTTTRMHAVLSVLTIDPWIILLPLIKLLYDDGKQTRRCRACGHIWRA